MTTPVAIYRLARADLQTNRFGISSEAHEYSTYPAIQYGNTFRYQMDPRGDVMKPIAAFIRTSDPPPPLDRLLEDLGSLKIATSNGSELVRIPIKLLVATTGVDLTYEGCDLTIPLSLDMYFPAVPMIRLQFSRLVFSIQTLSSTAAISVNFMIQNEYYGTDRRREFALQDLVMYPIQYLKTQTLVNPAHSTYFEFRLQTATLMKGFFVEGSMQDISGVDVRFEDDNHILSYNRQTLRMVAQPVKEDYLFVPFCRGAAYADSRTESYVGALYDGDPVSITITYCSPRYSSTLHGLLANNIRYQGGMCGLQFPTELQRTIVSRSPVQTDPMNAWARNLDPLPTWTTATRVLNPERNNCPITYEPITGDFCECDQCHHAFDATAFRNYVTSRSSPVTCPTCRAPWTAFMIYQQSDS